VCSKENINETYSIPCVYIVFPFIPTKGGDKEHVSPY